LARNVVCVREELKYMKGFAGETRRIRSLRRTRHTTEDNIKVVCK